MSFKIIGLPWFCVFWTCFLLLAIGLIYMSQGKILQIREWLFAKVYSLVVVEYNKRASTFKGEYFEKIRLMESRAPNLEEARELRILEIGVGPGSNFEFYPTSKLIVVEPNAFFESTFQANLKKFPHIILEKRITGIAEDMNEVESESIDVVVGSHVLCTISDVQQALQEVQRVLVPGGKYFFIEHVAGHPKTCLYFIQCFAKYAFWKALSGCNLVVDSGAEILKARFSDVDKKLVNIHCFGFWWLLLVMVKPNVVGVATKEDLSKRVLTAIFSIISIMFDVNTLILQSLFNSNLNTTS